jgi:hypothetical protein
MRQGNPVGEQENRGTDSLFATYWLAGYFGKGVVENFAAEPK